LFQKEKEKVESLSLSKDYLSKEKDRETQLALEKLSRKEENEKKKKKKEVEITNALIEQNVQPLITDKLITKAIDSYGATPAFKKTKSAPTVLELLKLVAPLHLWNLITEKVNDYIQKLGGLSDAYAKRHKDKYYSLYKIVKLVALHFEIEKYGKSSGYNIKLAWNEIDEIKKVGMSLFFILIRPNYFL
jgi:hypothetical protein